MKEDCEPEEVLLHAEQLTRTMPCTSLHHARKISCVSHASVCSSRLQLHALVLAMNVVDSGSASVPLTFCREGIDQEPQRVNMSGMRVWDCACGLTGR